MTKINEQLISFLQASPTAWHAVENLADILKKDGYCELKETEDWQLTSGGRYLVRRNGSSVIAFQVPEGESRSFRITASHSDSPAFRIKEDPVFRSGGGLYASLNTERYGGMLCAPWFDRPLSVAGRVAVRTEEGIRLRNVCLDRDLLLIPSLAIHMDRSANDGKKYEAQTDMLPLFSLSEDPSLFKKMIAQAAQADPDDLLATELFLYVRTRGTLWGADEEFLSAPRLDDLQCVFGCLKGFQTCRKSGGAVPVFCVFDNEEVGSETAQGAGGTFLEDTLFRVAAALGKDAAAYRRMVASSFLVSADNAHAVHPNHPEYADRKDRPVINGGVVIKHNAARKYTTDAASAALFEEICRRAEVPFQHYTNRADLAGGSTLGHISLAHVSVDSVDIGLAQLAMHSCYETAGAMDTEYLIRAIEAYYSLACEKNGEGFCIF